QRYPYHLPDELPVAEAIVVLGGSTGSNRPNWFEPYDRRSTVTRVDTAAALYHAGRAPRVIVSVAALDGTVSEAQIMANNLRQLGVTDEDIIQESRSYTNYEHATYTAQLLKAMNLNRAQQVTDALHLPRAMCVSRTHEVIDIATRSPPQFPVSEGTSVPFW